jgi:hypothetical protein
MGIGLVLSYMVVFAVSDSGPYISIFWKILSTLFFVFSFPILEFYWLFGFPDTDFLLGWALNCLLNGLLIERLFYLRKKKSKIQPAETGL